MVSEKDLQSYLKVAASALPCREARKEFSSYVHNVAHDISIENPDADFATVASLWEPRLNKSLQISWKVNRRKQYHGGIALHIVTNMACNY